LQKLRHTILEGLMGEAKNFHGMARARFRGLKKVEIQFLMTASALNLKRMVKIMDRKVVELPISKIVCDSIQFIKDIFDNSGKELAVQVPLATGPLLGKNRGLAGPGCEISNQFLKELINLKVILSI